MMASTRYDSRGYATPAPHDNRSTQQLLTDFGGQTGALLRHEIELAKLETKEQLARAGKAGVMFSGAGVAGFLALQLVSFAAAWGLAAVMPDGLAFLIVGAVYAVVAAILLSVGRKKASDISLVPQQTMQTLKEDAQWAKTLRK